MSQIDRTGYFRGKVLDRGVGETRNGYPQAILQLQATQMWDQGEETWKDWPYDEVEATAYICLFGGNGKATLGLRQVMKALGWDGQNFLDIQESKDLNDEIQWSMEENTYEGNTTIRVGYIKEYDAAPGRSINKLAPEKIKALQAKYAAGLKAASGGAKPKSAPKKSKADPTPPAEPAASPEPAPKTPPTAPAPEPPAAPDAKPAKAKKAKPLSKEDAWEQLYTKYSKAGKTQVEIANAWTDAVKAAGGDDVGDDYTGVKAAAEAALS